MCISRCVRTKIAGESATKSEVFCEGVCGKRRFDVLVCWIVRETVFVCLCVSVCACACVCVRVLVASCARGVASCIAAPGQALRCIVRSGHRPSIALHRGFRPPAMQRCIVRFGLRPCIALQRAFRPPAMHCVAACVSATGQALRCIARCGRCIVRCGRCIVRCVYMFTCLHAWHCIPTACPSFLLSSLELPCCS